MSIARWWHSKGFGIQSPWAFKFVTTVLKDRSNLEPRVAEYMGDTPWKLVRDIRKTNKKEWKEIVDDPCATAIFDMKDTGIAVYDPKRYKMIYRI